MDQSRKYMEAARENFKNHLIVKTAEGYGYDGKTFKTIADAVYYRKNHITKG